MATISRLKESEISPGNTAAAADIEAELDQLVNEHNSKETRLDQLETGQMSIDGQKTFSSTILANGLDERSTNNGVLVNETKIQRGAVYHDYGQYVSSVNPGGDELTTVEAHGLSTTDAVEITAGTGGTVPSGITSATTYYVRVTSSTVVSLHPTAADASADTNVVNITDNGTLPIYIHADPGVLTDGMVWYNRNDDALKVRAGGTTKTLLADQGAWPTGYIGAKRPTWVSTTQVQIPSGLKCRSDDDTVNITFSSNETIDITTSTGAGVVNALMNGLSESGDTWYYIWAIAKAGGAEPKGLINTSSTDITSMPTDYTVKRLIGVVRNDSSSNFLHFKHNYNDLVLYQENLTYYNGSAHTAGTMNVLPAGTSTSFASVDCSSFIPPISTVGLFHYYGVDSYSNVRPNGSSIEVGATAAAGAGTQINTGYLETSSDQKIDYIKRSGTSLYIDVAGFQMELTG